MKADAFGEIYLWNREIDRLVRVLQRMDVLSIRPEQELKAYELQLEEIRAGLNADFLETMSTRERADEGRLHRNNELLGKKECRGRSELASAETLNIFSWLRPAVHIVDLAYFQWAHRNKC